MCAEKQRLGGVILYPALLDGTLSGVVFAKPRTLRAVGCLEEKVIGLVLRVVDVKGSVAPSCVKETGGVHIEPESTLSRWENMFQAAVWVSWGLFSKKCPIRSSRAAGWETCPWSGTMPAF